MVHYDSISKQNFNDVLKGVTCEYHFADEDELINDWNYIKSQFFSPCDSYDVRKTKS